MADLPIVRRIAQEELGGDVPAWFTRGILYYMNLLIESEYTSLDKNINFAQNIDSQTKELTFTTASDYTTNDTFDTIKFASTLGGQASGMVIARIWVKDNFSTIITGATSVDWTEENGQLKIRFISGLSNSTTYVVRVMAWR